MFKNLTLFRIGPDWEPNLAATNAALQAMAFAPCQPTQIKSVGWTPPRGIAHSPMVESCNGQWVMSLMAEKKDVPSSVIKRRVAEMVEKMQEEQGRKVGRKEKKELAESVLFELLPQAFTKQSRTLVWINPKARLLAIDTSSAGRADEIVSLLVKSLDGLTVSLLQTTNSSPMVMGQWLIAGEAEDPFDLNGECELKSSDEQKSVVRYSRHRLDIDEVRLHITQGKVAQTLGVMWNDRMSFTLNGVMQLKKIKLLDVVFEGSTSADDGFDADAVIATSELSAMIDDLLAAHGGELAPLE